MKSCDVRDNFGYIIINNNTPGMGFWDRWDYQINTLYMLIKTNFITINVKIVF